MITAEKKQDTPCTALSGKRTDLIARFLEGKAPDFTEKHALLLDEYFQKSYEQSRIGPQIKLAKNPYAVIALGGYGRKEQCLLSDVDLMILFEKKVLNWADRLIREKVYPLWDLGLDVAHATRSVKECVELARKDISVLTSILDARFVCGMSNVYVNLIAQIRRRVLNGSSGKLIFSLLESNEKRRAYFGDSSYRLEPNLKEGLGGLRDYHTMLWIARIKSNIRSIRDLEYEGFLSHEEYARLKKALSFIFMVRSWLHKLTQRKDDRLYFEYQIRIAQALGFKDQNGQKGVERFLGKLHGEMEFIKHLYRVFLHEQGFGGAHNQRKRTVKKTRVQGLEINRGMIGFTDSEAILNKPALIMEIFSESDSHQLPLNAEAKRLVREFSFLVNTPLLKDTKIKDTKMDKLFEHILVQGNPSCNSLDEMRSTGILNRLIPEWDGIVNRIQFNEYHLYPVDKHSLYAVKILHRWREKEEKSNEPMCCEVYKSLSNPRLLHWAVLLHDIGKGQADADHSRAGAEMVTDILERFRFSTEDIQTVAFLVKEHLLLIKTATRRDINDEETCIFCARCIRDLDRLKMLYLLTIADSISTGPNAWNEWTSSLLRNLFVNVHKIIEKGELASEAAVQTIQEKKKAVKKALLERKGNSAEENTDGATFLNFLSPRYLLAVDTEEIMDHMALNDQLTLNEQLKDQAVVWQIRKNPESNSRTVTICARDAPGLFSDIAGVFTLNNIDILNAQVFTWRNLTALDIFEVRPPPDPMFEQEKWDRVFQDLKAVIKGDLDIKPILKEKIAVYRISRAKIQDCSCQVKVDNEASSFFTIIDVFAYDFPGLLFNITHTLFALGLDVWVAKIATKIDQVVDVFYVRDFDGQKIDSEAKVGRLKKEIAAVILGPSYRSV
ncbi:MAG: [protein-PII] uridylyltransferase [Desulfobacteraceae bacterium]